LFAIHDVLSTAIIYIYCDYKEEGIQTSDNLIASLAQQLIYTQRKHFGRILRLYRQRPPGQSKPLEEDTTSLLWSIVESFKRVFIVIDALDECAETNGTRDALIKVLTELQKQNSTVQVLITSRPKQTAIDRFQYAKPIEFKANDLDIRKYLESRIHAEPRVNRHVRADPPLEKKVIDTITTKCQDMFLLARLHMDSLALIRSLHALKTALQSCPRGASVWRKHIQRRSVAYEGKRKKM